MEWCQGRVLFQTRKHRQNVHLAISRDTYLLGKLHVMVVFFGVLACVSFYGYKITKRYLVVGQSGYCFYSLSANAVNAGLDDTNVWLIIWIILVRHLEMITYQTEEYYDGSSRVALILTGSTDRLLAPGRNIAEYQDKSITV